MRISDWSSDVCSSDLRPRALFERFNIEALATTEGPLDPLDHHRAIRDSGCGGRVITTSRPDPALDPDFEGFAANVDRLGPMAREVVSGWAGYLSSHEHRRAYFPKVGGDTATYPGHPTTPPPGPTTHSARRSHATRPADGSPGP